MKPVGLFLLASLTAGAATDGRPAATRSVSLLQKGLTGFQKAQDCYSCHNTGLPARVIRMARDRGIAVDETAAREAISKGLSAAPNLQSIDRALQSNRMIDPAAVESAALLAAYETGVPPGLTTALTAKLIAGLQRPDGHWTTLDNRPPEGESAISATAISARALSLYAPPAMRTKLDAQVTLARGWLQRAKPQSTEEFSYRLAGLAWTSADQATRTSAVNELFALQRPNGGWGQLPYRDPDAYATGQALTMLHEAGAVSVSDPRWKRGLDYLLSTQAPDGSWRVHTRLVSPAPVSPPYFESGLPYGHDQFISSAGTAWASMAVLHTVPVLKSPPKPLGVTLKMDGEKPWMSVAAFGSEAELKALLDGGLDPNSATAEGSSLLMFAVPDIGKVRLLLSRGADPQRKARNGFTPLLMASLYNGASPTVRLLLDRGASANPTGVQFNASPAEMAVFAGNTATLQMLIQAGAQVKRPFMLGGTGPMSLLMLATNLNEPDTMKTLISAGAGVKEKDGDGLTPLHVAAMGNRLEPAKLLIAAGAAVNDADTFGFTPLLYAATLDYGDDRMTKLLLSSGARRDAVAKTGETPLSQARKLGFRHIAAALR